MITFPQKKFDLYLDVGLSHNAPHSLDIFKNNQNAFVIGIEPNPENCNSVRNMNLGSRFHLIEAGASDTEGTLELNMMYPDPGTSSFLKVTNVLINQGYFIKNKVNVSLITLDTILSQVPWDLVNDGLFNLKSDTQGFEMKVLKGLKSFVTKIRNLQIESTTWGQYENASELSEIVLFLKDYMNLTKVEGENAWFVKK
jgi:FkbM family methyltransferase